MSTSDAVSFSDLAVGDTSAPLVIEGISRTHFVRYAGASGDFNPMHHDDALAQQYGNPSVSVSYTHLTLPTIYSV